MGSLRECRSIPWDLGIKCRVEQRLDGLDAMILAVAPATAAKTATIFDLLNGRATRLSTPDENSPFRRLKNPHPKSSSQCRKLHSALPPFPHIRKCCQNGPERSRARRFCAAQRTLDGEDRSATPLRRERGLVWFPLRLAGTDPLCVGPSSGNSRRGY